MPLVRFLSLAAVLAAAPLAGVHAAPVSAAKPAATVAAPARPVAAAQPTPVVRVLIKAGREARIASQMNGRISALPLRMGQSFSRGDLLVGFECDHQMAEQGAAEAMLLKAEKTHESRVQLASMKAVSDLDVQLAQADMAQARAQLDRARASVRDCRILAPYHGSVVRVIANQWENVGPGAPLLEIVERGNLFVEALVQSSWLTWIKPGSRLTITVDELGRDVTAEVTAIGARVDPVSQTIPVTARITGSIPGLRAGMSGNARFVR